MIDEDLIERVAKAIYFASGGFVWGSNRTQQDRWRKYAAAAIREMSR